MSKRVLISTVPFSEGNNELFRLLKSSGLEYDLNDLGRKFTETELAERINGYDGLIAGTEPITSRVLERANRLQIISRVGVGLDSVDLFQAKKNGVKVSYTPMAPAPAVADLTIGLMYSLLRYIGTANHNMHANIWRRYFGKRISEATIGIIGAGRIGGLVIKSLESLNVKRVLVSDPKYFSNKNSHSVTYGLEIDELCVESDLVSVHVPLMDSTRNLIDYRRIELMGKGGFLINTARGGVINEIDLFKALSLDLISGAAMDVFESEPYSGPLATLENCILTSHMGSMSRDCRERMEIEATVEVINFFTKNGIQGSPVPDCEYKFLADKD